MRSSSSFSRSIAIASLPRVMSPLKRHGPAGAVCSSLLAVSQATSGRGSLPSTCVDPWNRIPSAVVPTRPLSRSWVAPGARRSSALISSPSASDFTSTFTRASIVPASVTLSTAMLKVVGMGSRDMGAKVSARALAAASGRRRDASGSSSTRSRSICGDDSAPVISGRGPNVRLALPRSLTALSSGPYWNSI